MKIVHKLTSLKDYYHKHKILKYYEKLTNPNNHNKLLKK